MVFHKLFHWLSCSTNYVVDKSKFSLLAFILSFSFHGAFSQLSIVNSDMRMVEIGNLQVQGICNIVVNDTLNCNAIAIEITDDLNNVLVMNHEFMFDQVSGLPAGMSWHRKGNSIELIVGTFSADTIWKARIRLKDNSSNWTSWDEFILN